MNIEFLISSCRKYNLKSDMNILLKIEKDEDIQKYQQEIRRIRQKISDLISINSLKWFGDFSQEQQLFLYKKVVEKIKEKYNDAAYNLIFCNTYKKENKTKFLDSKDGDTKFVQLSYSYDGDNFICGFNLFSKG